MVFIVDNDAVIQHTNRLEKMHKSDFPLAVRGTLNDQAFDVKKKTMPASAEKEFVNRTKNFFKANSKVEMAKGFDIKNMNAKIGFISLKGNNYAVDELHQQEHGGKIKKRSFIPTDDARISRSKLKNVSKKNRLSGIQNIVKVGNASGKNDGQKFIKSVLHAGKGGHVLTEKALIQVNGMSRPGKKWEFKLKAIFTFKKNRSVTVEKTEFMKKACVESAKKGNKFYENQAERRYAKSR